MLRFARSALFFAFGLFACSEGEVPPEKKASDAGSIACAEAPSSDGASATTCLEAVTGTVVDSAAAPLEAAAVTVCGAVCFGGTTAANGDYRVAVNAFLPRPKYAVSANGRPFYAGLYVPLSGQDPTSTVLALPPIVLPRFAESAARLPEDGIGGALASGAVTLGIPSGTSWDLPFEDFADETEGRMFRQVILAPGQAPTVAPGAPLRIALGPFKAKPSKPISITVQTTVFPAGTPVEFAVMEDVFEGSQEMPGRFRTVASGHANSAGTAVTTDEGTGIDRLTWLAVRATR
jgi:hypothetical protein